MGIIKDLDFHKREGFAFKGINFIRYKIKLTERPYIIIEDTYTDATMKIILPYKYSDIKSLKYTQDLFLLALKIVEENNQSINKVINFFKANVDIIPSSNPYIFGIVYPFNISSYERILETNNIYWDGEYE